MLKKTLAFLYLTLSLSAHATFFPTAGLVHGADNYSVEVDGVTMTIDNPSHGGLINPYDGFDGLDFGISPIASYILTSFDVSFNKKMLVDALESPISLGSVYYSITGAGVASYDNYLSSSAFVGAPLIFQADLAYTFMTSTANVGNISGFYASEVPIPAAVWLFGSALLGLVSLKRKSKSN